MKPFFFKSDELAKLAAEHREAFQEHVPFRHIILDNFLPSEAIQNVYQEYLDLMPYEWAHYKLEGHADKKEFRDFDRLGPHTRQFFNEMNSASFINFLQQLTGIQGLIPDPHLLGGGFHRIDHGGFLDVHIDFNWYQDLSLYRRLNVIIYLNPEWHEEKGGLLELWQNEPREPIKTVIPSFNRCVIFEVTDQSFHGYPQPVNCEPGDCRKAMAFFYYTRDRPASEGVEPHPTIYNHV